MTDFPQSCVEVHQVVLSSEPRIAAMAFVPQPVVHESHSACAIARAAILGGCLEAEGSGL